MKARKIVNINLTFLQQILMELSGAIVAMAPSISTVLQLRSVEVLHIVVKASQLVIVWTVTLVMYL